MSIFTVHSISSSEHRQLIHLREQFLRPIPSIHLISIQHMLQSLQYQLAQSRFLFSGKYFSLTNNRIG